MRHRPLHLHTIVYAALIAPTYYALTLLNPFSFGMFQFRIAGLLMPLCLIHPVFGIALAFGTFLANLISPFGIWDTLIMPILIFIITQIAYTLRRHTLIATLWLILSVSASVACFPLMLGGALPFTPSFIALLISLTPLYLIGATIVLPTIKEALPPLPPEGF